MTGKVSDYLRGLIKKQVDDHGIVVWYDPEGHYAEFINDLNLPGASLEPFKDSFLDLRHRIEPLMGGLEPPRLIVYVPLDQAKTHSALAEVEAAGVVLRPGMQPWMQNTRLSVIAKAGLKKLRSDEEIAQIVKQVDAGKLSLDDLDRIAGGNGGGPSGLISIIFGIGNPHEVALRFLCSDRYDAEIMKKEAIGEFQSLMQNEFEISPQAGESLGDLRARLGRYVLVTDVLVSIKGDIPAQLTSVKIAAKPATREACTTLARTWRLRRDLRESYIDHAIKVGKEFSLSNMEFSLDQILGAETFLELEKVLQGLVEEALIDGASEKLVEIAKSHQSSFWSEQMPDTLARWSLIAAAGLVLLEADRIEKEIRSSPEDVRSFLDSYTSGDRPWYLLDTNHRIMERKFHDFSFLDASDRLERLVYKARNRYMDAGSALAERFLRLYAKDSFRINDILRQSEIFERKVKPALEEGSIAYIWVDALRFEMAQELVRILSNEFSCEIFPAMGSVPGITEIGMASLLPGAQDSRVVSVGDGKLGLEFDGKIVKNRNDRIGFLKEILTIRVFDLWLDDLLPTPKPPVINGIKGADLVLVTSLEIDNLCESDNVALARSVMDEILFMLQRGFRALAKQGVKNIIVAADHGYLFGDEPGIDMKIEAPGGDTVDLHRRIWIGHGGAANPNYLRAKISDFGLGGDLEIAAPWNFACFKAKGGLKAYFHGGLSPQEMVIPVITLVPKLQPIEEVKDIIWSLDYGGRKITTRFFAVKISGRNKGPSAVLPPRVRVELREGKNCISKPVVASYGFEDGTGDVQLKTAEKDTWSIEPNTITLMITKDPSQKELKVYVLNATTDEELASSKEIEVSMMPY
jgi:hypothetical protein